MSTARKHRKYLVALALVALFLAVTYSWTFTPYGRLDYRAALSLHLLSFEREIRPRPDSDFEIPMPVNLIYAISFALPAEQVGKVEDMEIPGNGVTLPARLYWPQDLAASATPPPVIVFFHGGGFVVGSVDIFDALTRSLANAASAVVISVDYRLAPEFPYPTPVNDSYAALEWIAQHAETLGVDASKLFVAGESAGASLATVVALRARDEKGPAITGQILYYPGTDLTDTSYPSRENFSEGYGFSRRSLAAMLTAYAGQVADRSDPYLSPLYAASLEGVPPALIVTAGFDPLTDSIRAYADRLEESGVPVSRSRYPTIIHGFMNIRVFPQRREALSRTAAFVKALIAGAPLHN